MHDNNHTYRLKSLQVLMRTGLFFLKKKAVFYVTSYAEQNCETGTLHLIGREQRAVENQK